jgi:hypothetical protein
MPGLPSHCNERRWSHLWLRRRSQHWAARRRRWRALRWAGLAAGLPAVWACHAPTLEAPNPKPSEVGSNVFRESLNRKIDLLFMIDNSNSMDSAQQNVKANFPAFMNVLQNLPGGLPDVHIAVVTSNMGAPGSDIDNCAGDGDGGVFRFAPAGGCTATNLMPGATFISDTGGASPVTNFSGDISAVFQCIAAVGSNGCGFEHQLASVARALGADGQPPPAENQGFLRDEAYLGIVLLTNEDDCSAPSDTPIFAAGGTLASTYGPFNGFACNEFGHLCSLNGGPPARPSRYAPNGLTSDVVTYSPAGGPDNCVSSESAGMLTPVGTGGYADWIKALKPDPASQILVAAITGPTTPYQVHWKDPAVVDIGPWPEITHSCGSEGDPAGYADPAVRVQQFVEEFGGNGLSYTFCSTDYSGALRSIAEALSKTIGPRCITGSIATRAGSTTPDCAVTEVVGTGKSAVSTLVHACDDVAGATPCWRLAAPDPATSSGPICAAGSHVVVVDRGGGQPPDDSSVDVQCLLCPGGAPPDPARTCVP